MFVGITNEPRHYAWGSRTLIPELLGVPPSVRPAAELWLGAHPLCPSRVLDPSQTGGYEHLGAWITADPKRTLGAARSSDELPFLMKLLAAEEPLSIQVHPDAGQARKGYAVECDHGPPVHSPVRIYKDPRHKPEIVLAVNGPFKALAGFRPLNATRDLIQALVTQSAHLPGAQRTLIELGKHFETPTASVLQNVMAHFLDGEAPPSLLEAVTSAVSAPVVPGRFATEIATLAEVAGKRPGDPGLLVALLLNCVTLEKGQAIYIPPGTVHAYLSGLAVEVMAASDNVVRGGLTDKHCNVQEFQRVMCFHETTQPTHKSEHPANGIMIYRPRERDFQLCIMDPPADEEVSIELSGPAIAIALSGAPRLIGLKGSVALTQGQSVFLTPDEAVLRVTGPGHIALAMPGEAQSGSQG